MNWFYSIDGQQAGPVSDIQLDELLNSGKINLDTLVWSEGMTEWQRLRAVRTAEPPPIPPSKSNVKCVECGRDFPPDEVVMLNRSWVCAGCKSIFLQRLREGATPSAVGGCLWRMNKQLVTRSEATFPDRCLQCNAPANGYRLKRQLHWHPPIYYLFIFLNLLIYAIVALCVQKRATIYIGLCEKHRASRKRGIIVCWFGFLAGIMLIIGGISAQHGGLMILFGGLLVLGGMIYGGITGTRISAAKITKDNVWLKGVHNDFLAELPEWTES